MPVVRKPVTGIWNAIPQNRFLPRLAVVSKKSIAIKLQKFPLFTYLCSRN
ncbi:hypothetical protein GGD38_005375 [Chitinophagaceae bacterium OAS944]|jgi:hypothetical protein|nr:hypothetical protein [Chitinophagaceae bacterium OAS944]